MPEPILGLNESELVNLKRSLDPHFDFRFNYGYEFTTKLGQS